MQIKPNASIIFSIIIFFPLFIESWHNLKQNIYFFFFLKIGVLSYLCCFSQRQCLDTQKNINGQILKLVEYYSGKKKKWKLFDVLTHLGGGRSVLCRLRFVNNHNCSKSVWFHYHYIMHKTICHLIASITFYSLLVTLSLSFSLSHYTCLYTFSTSGYRTNCFLFILFFSLIFCFYTEDGMY